MLMCSCKRTGFTKEMNYTKRCIVKDLSALEYLKHIMKQRHAYRHRCDGSYISLSGLKPAAIFKLCFE